MIRHELYKKTVDILYNAYFNDTLVHGQCTACAVGNIVAANLRYEFSSTDDEVFDFYTGTVEKKRILDWVGIANPKNGGWGTVFFTSDEGHHYFPANYKGDAQAQVESTGYSLGELIQIEKAFESVSKYLGMEDRMFNGLVAVLDVLKLIHEVQDNQPDVDRFREHHKSRVCNLL